MKTWMIVVALFAALVLCVPACDSGDDDDDTCGCYGDDDDDQQCAGQAPPELTAINLIVNDEPASMPLTIDTEDELVIEIEFSDADCDLEGASMIWQSIDNPGDDAGSDLMNWSYSGGGCSSEQDGAPFAFTVDNSIFTDAPQGCKLLLYLADQCGYQTEPVELQISLESK